MLLLLLSITCLLPGGRSLKTYYADDNGDDEDAPEKYICTCTCEKEEEKKEGDKVVHYYYPGYYHSWCKHCRRMLHEPAAGGELHSIDTLVASWQVVFSIQMRVE